MQKYAETEKCNFIATGHYAQIKLFNDKPYIYEGADPDKDQAFFLWGYVHTKGEILGKHKGITNYTIGQRRGLGLNLNFPVFVSEILVDANEIVLGKYEDLYRSRLVLNGCQFVDKEEIKTDCIYQVKVRYRLQLTPCRIHILDKGRAEVELLNSEAMIANGQMAVFYDGDRLIGGGFIESSE